MRKCVQTNDTHNNGLYLLIHFSVVLSCCKGKEHFTTHEEKLIKSPVRVLKYSRVSSRPRECAHCYYLTNHPLGPMLFIAGSVLIWPGKPNEPSFLVHSIRKPSASSAQQSNENLIKSIYKQYLLIFIDKTKMVDG